MRPPQLLGADGPARLATGQGAIASRLPTTTNRKGQPMGLFSYDIKTMDDLFVHTLQDIYYAEKQILKALPKMIEKATNPALKQGFETHLRETEGHVKRVEQVFEMHGAERKAVDCPAIDGIIKEANEVAGEIEDKQVLDAALIASAQAVEHYEITRYGTLIAWAKELGREDCASVLQQNLDEEKATDEKLTELAESRVNLQAAE
jgi:ferritin-like metal-binding protein YciE